MKHLAELTLLTAHDLLNERKEKKNYVGSEALPTSLQEKESPRA